jgi:transcriptional regulator with XRE-family HTH domain
LRQLSGMSQVELGRAAQLSNSYIGSLERGSRTAVSPAAFVRLCDALSILDRTELIDDDDLVSAISVGASGAQSGAMRAGEGAR